MFLPEKEFPLQIKAMLHIEWKDHAAATASPRPFHAFSYRISGEGRYKFGNDEELTVGAGQLLFVPKGLSYEIEHSPSELFVIHFDSQTPVGEGKIEVCRLHEKFPFQNYFTEMYETWNGQEPGGTYRTAALFYDLLGGISAESGILAAPDVKERMRQTVLYLRRRFNDPALSVGDLARHFGSSEVYFRRIFEETTGVTPLAYVRDLRVNYARELLASGYYTVAETAERCGFTDVKYFARLMKKTCGKSPSEFRLK